MLIFEGKGENVYIEHKHSLLFLFCVFYMHFSTSTFLQVCIFGFFFICFGVNYSLHYQTHTIMRTWTWTRLVYWFLFLPFRNDALESTNCEALVQIPAKSDSCFLFISRNVLNCWGSSWCSWHGSRTDELQEINSDIYKDGRFSLIASMEDVGEDK